MLYFHKTWYFNKSIFMSETHCTFSLHVTTSVLKAHKTQFNIHLKIIIVAVMWFLKDLKWKKT